MRPSRGQQLEQPSADAECTLAKPLAPEEIRPGDFVSMLHEIAELPSFFWCADATVLPANELIRIQYVPEGGGIPMKVKSVCLPFVLVKSPFGDQRTLDVRQCRLARLDGNYARTTWKSYKKSRGGRKSKRKQK
jgi:hypothetical protein